MGAQRNCFKRARILEKLVGFERGSSGRKTQALTSEKREQSKGVIRKAVRANLGGWVGGRGGGVQRINKGRALEKKN